MLSIEHIEDYLSQTIEEHISISFDVEGHKRLNDKVKLPLNLNKGYTGSFDETHAEHRTIEIVLKWMIEKSPEGNLEKILCGAQFVSRRGVLVKMAAGEYLKEKGDWSIFCEKKNGVVYIEEECSEAKKKYNRTMPKSDQLATYMGHKFEECMLLPPPNKETNDLEKNSSQISLNSKADLRMVVIGDLKSEQGKGFKLLYCAEVDAVDKEDLEQGKKLIKFIHPKNLIIGVARAYFLDGQYMELKTQKNELGGYWFWKEKSLKWWIQSKLVGINCILVGIKDSGGFIRQLKKINLNFLENSNWDGEKCLQFLLNSLNFIYENVPEGRCCRIYCQNGNLRVNNNITGQLLSTEFKTHFKL